jgi:HNH endonuclease
MHYWCSVNDSNGLQAVRRDQGRCLVTKAGAYNQVAHIYPYCLGARFSGVSRDMFWSSLSLFWTRDQIKSWKDVILGEKGTENCVNLVTLSATAHVYWGKALFALKPISLSEDKRTLEVGFYWLRQFSHASWVDPLFRAEHFFPHSCVGNDLRLFDCKTGREICSGDTIVLRTPDPALYPLPSMPLLEMQWILQQVAALSGAADGCDEAETDYDNDGTDFFRSVSLKLENLLPKQTSENSPM